MTKIKLWPQGYRRISRLVVLCGIASVLVSTLDPLSPWWLRSVEFVLGNLFVLLANKASTKCIKALVLQGLQKPTKAIVLQTLLELDLVPANHREQDLLK